MKIGIVDDMFYALQRRLLDEGHELYVYVTGESFNEPLPAELFNVTPARPRDGQLNHVTSLREIVDANVAFVITGTGDDERSYEFFTGLNILVLGHSVAAILFETDREYCNIQLRDRMKIRPAFGEALKLPETHYFTDRERVKEFLEETDDMWVIKQTRHSDQSVISNRTVVIEDPANFVAQIDRPNAWFNKDGKGGCVLEEYVKGQEVCFGAWFNGETFVGPIYSCIEHKGAQNGDRGFILTGEVGTTITMHSIDGKIGEIFRSVAPLFRDKCRGMIDINTILTDDGELYMVEFTVRFGRPTLELLIHHSQSSFDWGYGMLDVAIGAGSAEPSWNRAYTPAHHSVGVTAYSYGYPFLDFWAPLGLPEEVTKRMWEVMPYANVIVDAENMPETLTRPGTSIQQMFARFTVGAEEWSLPANERQWMFCGKSHTEEGAIGAAYGLLEGFNVTGITWRDDIGKNLAELNRNLLKHGIVKD